MGGWLITPGTGVKTLPCVLPGLKDFYMTGQWISPDGGPVREFLNRGCRSVGIIIPLFSCLP